MVDEYIRGYPVDLRAPAMAAREATGPYGDFERRAARVVARASGLKTVIQDDNHAPRTPDLRIEDHVEVVGVGEIVTTTEGARAAQIRAFSAGQLEFESGDLRSTWWVTVTPRARRAGLKHVLVDAFARLEERGDHVQVDGRPSLHEPFPEIAELELQGLTEAYCDPAPRDGPGKIYGLPEGIGGPVAMDWGDCAGWIEQFLRSELCSRKVDKLKSIEVRQRHLYVGITGNDRWAVHQALEVAVTEVALPPPSLPDGVSHLWLDNAEFPSRVIAGWPDRGWFDVRTSWATE